MVLTIPLALLAAPRAGIAFGSPAHTHPLLAMVVVRVLLLLLLLPAAGMAPAPRTP